MAGSSPRSRSRTVVRWAFVVVVAAAVVLALHDQAPQLGEAFRRVGAVAVLESQVAVLAGLFASALCWRSLLASLGSPLPPRTSLYVFFVGQLGKYLPGNVFAVAAQAELAHDHGVPRTRVVTAGLVFLGVLTTTGLVVALALLPFASPDALRQYAWALLALPLGVIALAPPVLDRLLRVGLRLVRRPAPEAPLDRRRLASALGWALLMWGCYGLHLLPLVQAQPHVPGAPGPLAVLLACTGAYALAWTAGFLFLIAPAGAVVREAVLVLALSGIAHRPEAAAVALVSRGTQTLGDLLWAGAALAFCRDVAAE